LLEVPQLPHEHGMPKVQVGRGGVKAGFHAERPTSFATLLKALAKIGDTDNFGCAFLQQVHLFINRKKRTHLVQYKD
jgi:hypothetical protein